MWWRWWLWGSEEQREDVFSERGFNDDGCWSFRVCLSNCAYSLFSVTLFRSSFFFSLKGVLTNIWQDLHEYVNKISIINILKSKDVSPLTQSYYPRGLIFLPPSCYQSVSHMLLSSDLLYTNKTWKFKQRELCKWSTDGHAMEVASQSLWPSLLLSETVYGGRNVLRISIK